MRYIFKFVIWLFAGMLIFQTAPCGAELTNGSKKEIVYVGKIVDILSITDGGWIGPGTAIVLLDNNEKIIISIQRFLLFLYEETL